MDKAYPEIKVTPEMIDAGVDVFFALQPDWTCEGSLSASDLVGAIIRSAISSQNDESSGPVN